jgi:ABC-type phosphate transport system substrate-binding protein
VPPVSASTVPALALGLAVLLAPPPAGGQPVAPGAAAPRFTSATLPRLDGSTSAEPLLALLACRLLGIECDWHPLHGAELPRSPRPKMPVEWPPVFPRGPGGAGATLLTSSTGQAYGALIGGRADLILVAREPSGEERRMAGAAGVTLRVSPVAWDALVFVVNRANAVESLTLDQIRDVYAGRARRWTDVGGQRDEPVRPLLRNPGSGSGELFAKHVTAAPAGEVAGDRLIMTMMGLIDAVGTGQNDLGYTVYYYAKAFLDAARPPRGYGAHFKLIAVDGVAPTDETIASGAYRLREPVYAVVRGDAPAAVAGLPDWLLGADGQRLVVESRYVPLRPGR